MRGIYYKILHKPLELTIGIEYAMPTRFYKLWFSDKEPDPMLCDEEDLKGLSEYVIFQDRPILDWPQDPPAFLGARGEIEDYLHANLNGWHLFSDRTCAIFQKHGVRGVDFHPVKVIIKETGEEIVDYKVAHFWNLIEGLNRERSDWLPDDEEPDKVLIVFTVVLKSDVVQNEDTFRLAERSVSVFFSARIVKDIRSQKLTGFKFFPIKDE